MHQFRIIGQENGGFRFELHGIKMLVEGYTIQNGNHLLTNPAKAVAYFNFENNIYGISNELTKYMTAEEFHDAMENQMNFLKRTA